jgi:hypothetical protein
VHSECRPTEFCFFAARFSLIDYVCAYGVCLCAQVPGGPSGSLGTVTEQKGKSYDELPDKQDTYYLMAGFIQYDLR